MADQLQPWKQQPGENSEAYARFRCFVAARGKSLRKAYAQWLISKGRLDRYDKEAMANSPPAPVGWSKLAKKYKWKDRFVALELSELTRAGARTIVNFIKSQERLSDIVKESLKTVRPGSREWEDVLATQKLLADFLSPNMTHVFTQQQEVAGPPLQPHVPAEPAGERCLEQPADPDE